jgi:hypothetical protein
VESVLGGAPLQCHVHDCVVRVYDGQHSFTYDVYFKRHKSLPVNRSIRAVVDQDRMRGDVLVMRRSSVGGGVVNMRELDTVMADRFMSRLVHYSIFYLCFSHSIFQILVHP